MGGNGGNNHDCTGIDDSWQQLVGSLNDEVSFASLFYVCLRAILIPFSIIVVGADLANNPLHTAIYDSPCAVATTSRLDKC